MSWIKQFDTGEMAMKLSVIGPMYNEGKNVEAFVDAILMISFTTDVKLRIVLVDDGSTDDTWVRMLSVQAHCSTPITLVKLAKNFGLESAIKAGLASTRDDVAVVMDADLQDPPDVILELIAEWRKGFQIVHAIRGARKFDSVSKRISATAYYRFQSFIFPKLSHLEGAANFKLLSRQVIDTYLHSPQFFGIFRIEIPKLDFASSVVYYDRSDRVIGDTKFNLLKILKFLGQISIATTANMRKIPSIISFLLLCALNSLLVFRVYPFRQSLDSFNLMIICLLTFLLLFQMYYLVARRNLIRSRVEGRPQFVIEHVIESKVS